MDARARHLLRRALSAGRTREALALAEHTIAEDASDGEAVALAAMAEAELGRWDAACERLVATAGTARGGLWLRDAALLVIRRAPGGAARMALAQRLSTGVSDASGTLLVAHAECLIAAGRFEDAAARVVPASPEGARTALASRLVAVGERLRAAGDGRASAALDAALRLLRPGSTPELALQVAQLAASLGRFGDAMGQLRDARDGIAALAGGEAILTRIFNAACDTGELEAARQVLDLMPSPPEPMRMRCAVALVEAGHLEDAARLAAALSTPALRAEMAERLLRAGGDGPVLPLLEGLLLGPGLPFRVLLRVLATVGRRGDLDAATTALRAAPSGDEVEREMAEVALLWARGDLGSARRRLDDALARSPEDARLLRAAFDAARQAPDPPAAAKLAARLAATLDDDEAFGVFWALARAMSGEGLENDARTLLRRVQTALRRLVDDPGNADVGLLYAAFRTALDIYDVRTARQLVGRLPGGHLGAAIWAEVERVIAHDDEVARFAEVAGVAFAAAGSEAAACDDADLSLIVPPRLLPAIDIPASGAPARSVEDTAGRHAMARILALAARQGLVARIAPALGYHVPDAVQTSRGTFASWHSFGEMPRGVHLKAGPLPDTLLIDPGGYSGWSRIARLDPPAIPLGTIDGALATSWRAREVERLRSLNLTKYRQSDRGIARLPVQPALLVALQLPRDSVMAHARVDMFSLTRAVVAAFRGSGRQVLIKRHPTCEHATVDALLRDVASEPHVTLTDASIHDLFAVVKAVYCVNSGVGAEALLYGLPVHISGLTDYRHVCHEIHRVEDIRADDSAFRLPVDEPTFDRYVYWYRNIHHVPLDQPGALDAAIEERILRPALARRDASRH